MLTSLVVEQEVEAFADIEEEQAGGAWRFGEQAEAALPANRGGVGDGVARADRLPERGVGTACEPGVLVARGRLDVRGACARDLDVAAPDEPALAQVAVLGGLGDEVQRSRGRTRITREL